MRLVNSSVISVRKNTNRAVKIFLELVFREYCGSESPWRIKNPVSSGTLEILDFSRHNDMHALPQINSLASNPQVGDRNGCIS